MRTSIVALAAGGHEVAGELAVSPVWFGVITLSVLLFMLLVTFAFRSVYKRH